MKQKLGIRFSEFCGEEFSMLIASSEGDRADEPKDRRKIFDRSDNISVHSSGRIGLEDSFSGTMRLYNIHGQELMYEHYTETSVIPIPALLSGVYVAVFATSLGECSTKKINVYE